MPDPALSIERIRITPWPVGEIERIIVQKPITRILAFTGITIDQLVSDPLARNTVYGYFKLYKQIQRRYEVIDLERQWNALWAVS